MKKHTETAPPSELELLCASVRERVAEKKYETCVADICAAMGKYPHAPEPHNLLGIVLEKTGDHVTAMKHFRAATVLDPNYMPANHNLHTYGTFYTGGSCAFDFSDVQVAKTGKTDIFYNGFGRNYAAGMR